MNSLFDTPDAVAILSRLAKLTPDSKALWGKMSVDQMLAHCQAPLQVALGEKQLKRTLIGFLFGAIAKKQLTNEKPFSKNMPTDPGFVIREERDFINEFQKLEKLIERFAESDPEQIASRTHPFFGKMTPEQWGILSWKHLDHHLRQFNA